MAGNSLAQPHISLLNPEQLDRVHAYALGILANTGVRVDSEPARRLLAGKLGPACVQGDRVRIPAEWVEWALKNAPAAIDIYDRAGRPAFRLGDGRARFGIGVTTLFYQDPQTDEIVPFARRHMRDLVRLGSLLPNFDVISTIGIVQDVPPGISDLVAALEMAANTLKPLVLLVSDEQRFPAVLDLLEQAGGRELGDRPFVLPYFNPVTPLILNQGTADKMRDAIERGLPVIFSNYSMAGLSSPITPAGTLALLMAELLSGLVLSQVIREGAPVILGMLPAYFDMKTMMNFYDPQSMLLNLACAEMMAHYHLPHCGTSGSGTGWGPDLLSAETYWMNHIIACLTKGGLAPFVGDTLGSKAFSATNMVYVHEIIAQAMRLAQGFQLDDDMAGLGEIEAAGPGGDFLRAGLTRRLFRNAYYTSPIFPRWSMEKWQAEGRPPAIQLLRDYTCRLLSDLPAPDDHAEVLVRGERLIRKLA